MDDINNITFKFEKKAKNFSKIYSRDKVGAKFYRLLIERQIDYDVLKQLNELYADLIFINDMNSLLIEKINKVLSSYDEVKNV